MPPPGARSPLTIPAEWRKCGPNKHSGRKKRRPLLLFAEKVVYFTGKVAIVGNNVSHSHHKTKRKFSPNLKTKRFWSEQEGRWITLKVSAAGMKTINKKGLAAALREAAAPKSVY